METAPTSTSMTSRLGSEGERLRRELQAAKLAFADQARELAQAKAELAEVKARHLALFERSPQAVYRADIETPIPIEVAAVEQVDLIFRDGQLAECNGTMAGMYGLDSAEALVGIPVRHLLPEDDPVNRELLRQFVENGYSLVDFDTQELAVDGTIRHFVNSIAGVVVDGKLISAWGTQRDVTAQKLFERTLKHSDERFRAWAEAAGQVFFTTDEYGDPINISESFTTLTGYPVEICITEPWKKFVHPDDWPELFEKWTQHFETNRPFSHEYRMMCVDGSTRHVMETSVPILNEHGTVIEWVGAISDITHKVQMEHHLRQTEKLAALGRLVAGVAPEINNPLTVVQVSAQLLELHDDPGVIERAGTIRGMCDRISRIVSSLLTFARGGTGERRSCRLNAIVKSAVEMATLRLAGSEASIRVRYVEANPSVMVDSAQIEQVVLNLVVNAEHALRSVEGTKEISISTETSPDGLEACIRVADNGHGMTEDVRSRIFDPFFTTKPFGEGNGLGLSICHGIVEAHGGSICVESEAGSGAVFAVRIPIYQERAV